MGTKNNPGKFDCYAKAEPDEPMFTLLGRDPQAAHLVSVWSKIRMGDHEAARRVFEHLLSVAPNYPREGTTDADKAIEAMDCSLRMFEYAKLGKAT